MITMYGIKNCDTIKKARRFLESNRVEFEFIDFREHQIEQVGESLRSMMPWINKNKIVDQAKN